MITLYLLVVLVLHITEKTDGIVEHINGCLNTSLSGVAMFFIGLIIMWVIESIK